MEVSRDKIVEQLEAVRREKGEAAYLTARRNLAALIINSPGGEAFLKDTFSDLDLEPIRQEAAKRPQMGDLIQLIKTHVPSIRSQSQLDLFMASFTSLTLALESYFTGNLEQGDRAREALLGALETAKRVRGIQAQVEEIPPEERSANAAAFVNPPKEFTEQEEQRQLLIELATVTNAADLGSWYATNRQRIDRVVTKKYRDELFDAIRGKQMTVAN